MLQQLGQSLLQGWPSNSKELPPGIDCFYHIYDELVDGELMCRDMRCLIPTKLRRLILCTQGNCRIAGTNVAKSVVVLFVQSCQVSSQLKATAAQKEALFQHERIEMPWAKVATHLSTVNQREFLFAVDYWSN